MRITMKGHGRKLYSPEEVDLTFRFEYTNKNYKNVFQKGTQEVSNFVNLISNNFDFSKKDFQTNQFQIIEDKIYNDTTMNYEIVGYKYLQQIRLVFPYKKERLFRLLEFVSNMESAPFYTVDFNIINKNEKQHEVLELAYDDALAKAQVLASKTNKTVKNCLELKIENEDFYVDNYDRSKFYTMASEGVISFVPQDILLAVSIVGEWEAS